LASDVHLSISKARITMLTDAWLVRWRSMERKASLPDNAAGVRGTRAARRWWHVVEKILLIAGVALLATYGAAQLEAVVAADAAMRDFAAAPGEAVSAAPSPVEGIAAPAETAIALAAQGKARAAAAKGRSSTIAVVNIPAIHLSAPLLEGTDALTLHQALGRIVGTARPGEGGNIGIAGHRDGLLRGLKDIKKGDRIELRTRNSTDVVDEIQIVTLDRVDVLKPRAVPSLTLVTCYPFHFLGAAPQRFVVTASLTRR
jgi:sortase A